MDFRQYLEYFGWSQAELARRIGVTPDTVSRWKGRAPQVVLMYLETLKDWQELLELELANLGSRSSDERDTRGES